MCEEEDTCVRRRIHVCLFAARYCFLCSLQEHIYKEHIPMRNTYIRDIRYCFLCSLIVSLSFSRYYFILS
jgi:hypothetical protein